MCWIGPYTQNKDEIEKLARGGVKVVLNLQTRSDMKHRSVNFSELKRIYHENQIRIINFPIKDMSIDELRYKAYEGAYILNELLNKYGGVFIFNFRKALISVRKLMCIAQQEFGELHMSLRHI